MEKIELAEKLVSDSDINNINKGIKIYSKLCLDSKLSSTYRLTLLSSLIQKVPDEGESILSRLRDMIPHCRGSFLEDLVRILVGVTRSSKFNSHERVLTAVTLLNNGLFNVCYGCFSDLANDRTIDPEYRVESSRYLFGSEVEENIEDSKSALLDVINNQKLSSKYRYEVIAGFIKNTGIYTRLNTNKIKIPYNEEFVHDLQTSFFNNEDNGIRERILSGQHLLQMSCIEAEEKEKIINSILDIAKNGNLEENIRADAADVIFRLCTGEYRKEAREIITNLGKSAVGSGKIEDRSRTLYDNSQNIHDKTIEECISKFIEKIINETNVKLRPYDEVHNEVCALIRRNLKTNRMNRALKSMNRILLDTAVFTENKITLSEIFLHVWIRIQSHPEEERKELENRMLEELVDMADTCSSGHSGRFVNVLSTYDSTLQISWESQIKANLSGRIQARIRDLDDENFGAKIVLGMMNDADKEDREEYMIFIKNTLQELHKELYDEFVGEGYISKEEFGRAFEIAKEKWI